MPTFAGPASLAEKPARPSLVGRLLGNRDFILVIDCLEQGAVLTPPGQPFDLREPDAPARLARAVRTLVERRQATVRPGEPPYRPAIQFRVSADGRRTYHAVWPSLAELGIPLMRESTD